MIYYCYEKETGRFAGSGTVNIRTATHACTTTAPDEDSLDEEEMDWQFKDGKWLRKVSTDITAASLIAIEP